MWWHVLRWKPLARCNAAFAWTLDLVSLAPGMWVIDKDVEFRRPHIEEARTLTA